MRSFQPSHCATRRKRRRAAVIFQAERQSREQFLGSHVETVYGKLTNDCRSFVRAEKLVDDAAALLPGLVPAVEELSQESERPLKDKDGLEVDQGIFLSHVLGHSSASRHLCHAMLLPSPKTLDRLTYFRKHGAIDLGTGRLSTPGVIGSKIESRCRVGATQGLLDYYHSGLVFDRTWRQVFFANGLAGLPWPCAAL
jgi:hypothetical protein